MARRDTYTGLSMPAAVVEHHSLLRSNGGRQIDWSAVPESFRQTPGQRVVVGAGGAAQNAVAVPVEALDLDIPTGKVVDFGGGKFARLTAPAVAGAVVLAVAALPTALVAGDAAVIAGDGPKLIPAFTGMVEVTPGGKVAPRIGVGVITALAGKTLRFIAETNCEENNRNDALSGYGMLVGGSFHEPLMPDSVAGVWPAGWAAEFRANGGVLNFFGWNDSRAG